MPDQTIVLVHGAWHGAWCYRRVAELLRRSGYRVYTPTLTGLGERSHLLSRSINLSTHIADIANLIRWEEIEQFVLVGHSYGGMVVTGVADAMSDRVSALVYLDGILATAGKRSTPSSAGSGRRAASKCEGKQRAVGSANARCGVQCQ